jgi:hypothetical protein
MGPNGGSVATDSEADSNSIFYFGNANEKTTFYLIFVLWGECLAGALDEA